MMAVTAASPRPACCAAWAVTIDTDLDGVPVVGDSLRDMQAAAVAPAHGPFSCAPATVARTETALLGERAATEVYDDLGRGRQRPARGVIQ